MGEKKKQAEQEQVALLIERWPAELRKALKIEAAKQERTMRECLIEAVEQWLEGLKGGR